LFEDVGRQASAIFNTDEKTEDVGVVETVEKKRKARKEKDGGKQGKKRKRDEFFEVVSKAFELG
jgi:hypothetical protein